MKNDKGSSGIQIANTSPKAILETIQWSDTFKVLTIFHLEFCIQQVINKSKGRINIFRSWEV